VPHDRQLGLDETGFAPGPGPSLRLQILGPMQLWRDGTELHPGPRQQAQLLAMLLAHPGRPISTTDLIDLIWDGDVVPASALNVIHKYVGALRRLLQPGLPVRGTSSYLLRRENSYVFRPGPGELDAVTFRDLVRSAEAARAGPRGNQAALDYYAEALALWHGPAGEGLAPGSGAASVFAGLEGEFSDACAAATELALALGRPERVLRPLQLAARMAPLHEPVQAALIAALSAAGQHAEAVMVFHTIRRRLSEELGIDPGPAVQAAYLEVLTRTTDLRTAVQRGDHAAALRLAAAEVDRAQAAGEPDGQVAGLTAMARVALACHDLAHAEVLARTALDVAAGSGEPRLEHGPRDVLAAIRRPGRRWRSSG
jgi:DNA-binding SARP family transcriptional activator